MVFDSTSICLRRPQLSRKAIGYTVVWKNYLAALTVSLLQVFCDCDFERGVAGRLVLRRRRPRFRRMESEREPCVGFDLADSGSRYFELIRPIVQCWLSVKKGLGPRISIHNVLASCTKDAVPQFGVMLSRGISSLGIRH